MTAKEIDVEERELSEEDLGIPSQQVVAPMEIPPSCGHSSKSTAEVVGTSSSNSRKRKRMSDMKKCVDIIEGPMLEKTSIFLFNFLGNDPIFIEKEKTGKETETISPPDSDPDQGSQISTELTLFDKTWPMGNSEGFVYKQDEETDMIAQKLKKFSSYTPEEEETERVSQVSTKLKLYEYEDPWKIKKVLWPSDCSTHFRLMLEKEAFEQHVLPLIKINGEALESNGREFKIWDYDTKTEHVMKLEIWTACYVFTNWKSEFVKRRGLKSGDEIGMFWNNIEERFWFRVLAIGPVPQPARGRGLVTVGIPTAAE